METPKLQLIAPEKIIRMLEEPTIDRRPIKANLQKYAPIKALIYALQISKNELTRRILCDILAARKAKSAVQALVECLDDPSMAVRDDAAEALGKIGSPIAGKALLSHFIDDPRSWYAAALGAIQYQPAIPHLIDALSSKIGDVRGSAAWALGEMQVKEAQNKIEQVIQKEENEYVFERMREALNRIKLAN